MPLVSVDLGKYHRGPHEILRSRRALVIQESELIHEPGCILLGLLPLEDIIVENATTF